MTISFQVKVFADGIDRQKGTAAATSGAEEILRTRAARYWAAGIRDVDSTQSGAAPSPSQPKGCF
jgi:hypothetical protein